jgi:hypothetical protein
MFEIFLQMAVPLAMSTAEDESGRIIDKTVNKLISSIDKAKTATGTIKTEGSKQTPPLIFSLDGKQMKWKGGSQKIDVAVKSPLIFPEEKLLNISAKSYAALSNIKLLTGEVVPLILSWPIDNDTKSYYFNALYSANSAEYLEQTRCVFAI